MKTYNKITVVSTEVATFAQRLKFSAQWGRGVSLNEDKSARIHFCDLIICTFVLCGFGNEEIFALLLNDHT
jgi:hypothetical protein